MTKTAEPGTSVCDDTATRSFRAIGTTVTVAVTKPNLIDHAEEILRIEVENLDRACSRFRPDSELAVLESNAGRPTVVSPLLFEALVVAYSVAEKTRGAVDPTVGSALCSLGYDRDFDEIEDRPLRHRKLTAAPGFRHLHLNRKDRTARIPKGVTLDLGSSAKAFLADRAANTIASQLRAGALVSLGGDVAVAGRHPGEGWPVGIAVDSAAPEEELQQVVAIRRGGLASSSTETRAWVMGNEPVHHIVDPTTGRPASPYWRLVSASGDSCVDANALTTAAIVWGESALIRLRSFNQAVRLLRHNDQVVTLGGWPRDEER